MTVDAGVLTQSCKPLGNVLEIETHTFRLYEVMDESF